MQLLGSAIICPTHKPCCTPPRKISFINVEKPFNGWAQMVKGVLGEGEVSSVPPARGLDLVYIGI